MSTWMEEMGLHAEGFNDTQIAQIDAVRDDVFHVIATIQAIWPRLTRIMPVAVMVAEQLAANQKAGQI